MAKRETSKSHPRSQKRSRSGSTSLVVSILGAAAAGIWYLLADAGMVPGIPVDLPGRSSEQTSAPVPGGHDAAPTPSGPNAEAEAGTAPAASGNTIVGTATVVDADTIDIHGQRMRLNGVDAPESHQNCKDKSGKLYRCGSESANALDAWINRNPVNCVVTDKDRYGRGLADCSVRGASIQEWLVTNGHAMAYRNYSTAYVPAELKARESKVGIWAGEFIAPWDWRQGLRLDGEPPTKAMLDGKFDAD